MKLISVPFRKGFICRSCILLFVSLSLLLTTACPPPTGSTDPTAQFDTIFRKLPDDFFVVDDLGSLARYSVPTNVSTNCITNLYLDATTSMIGFLNSGKTNLYADVLNKLSMIAYVPFRDGTFNYYKFWESPVQITPEEFRKSAFDKSFYNPRSAPSGNDPKQTNIVSILEKISTDYSAMTQEQKDNNVSIIVSDMVTTEENDRDFIIKYLNEFFIRDGQAVALIGIKSMFDGYVNDVFVNGVNKNFQYNGLRPYYLLMIGRIPNIKAYLEEFNVITSSIVPEDQINNLLIYSPVVTFNGEMNTGIMKWDETDANFIHSQQASDMFDKSLLNNPSIQKAECVSLFYGLPIEIPDKNTLSGQMTIASPYAVDPDSILKIKQWNVTANIKSTYGVENDYEPEESADITNTVNEVISNPEQIKIINSNYEKNSSSVKIDISLNLKSMVRDQVYLANMEVFCKPVLESKDVPAWVHEWTMNMTGFGDWVSGKTAFNEPTTPYLADIFETLLRKIESDAKDYPTLKFGEYTISFISCDPVDEEFEQKCLDEVDKLLNDDEESNSEEK